MNLEKLNLVELSSQEVQETEGGFWHYVVGAIVGAAFCQDFGKLRDAYNDGYNAGSQP